MRLTQRGGPRLTTSAASPARLRTENVVMKSKLGPWRFGTLDEAGYRTSTDAQCSATETSVSQCYGAYQPTLYICNWHHLLDLGCAFNTFCNR